jgi:adenylate kinase
MKRALDEHGAVGIGNGKSRSLCTRVDFRPKLPPAIQRAGTVLDHVAKVAVMGPIIVDDHGHMSVSSGYRVGFPLSVGSADAAIGIL